MSSTAARATGAAVPGVGATDAPVAADPSGSPDLTVTITPEASEAEAFQEVIARARTGDPDAWSQIYRKFAGPVYGFFVHQVRDPEAAEDLTAGVFVEAIQAAARFQGSLSALRSWIFRIARNDLVDYWRHARRVQSEAIDDVDDADLARAIPVDDPADTAISSVNRSRLLASVHRLSPEQRQVVLLRLSADLSSAEIAKVMGKSEGAIKALQYRALAVLRKALVPAADIAGAEARNA
ncbi:MAG: RNA polymerase sigma factor [Actinomycetota bacterium]